MAATEFALVIPIFLALVLGGAEFTNLILLHQKLEKLAFSVADVTSRYETLNASKITVILNASSELLPSNSNFSSNGKIYVSSVQMDKDLNDIFVEWQCDDGGPIAASSRVGVANSPTPAVLPGNLALAEEDDVIVAEVFYNYMPLFNFLPILAGLQIEKTALFRPRLGNLTTDPGC